MKKLDIIDYLKCAYANKFTFAGYLTMAAAIGLAASGKPEASKNLQKLWVLGILGLGEASCGLLLSTAFGLATLNTYRATKEYIKYIGKVKEKYEKIQNEVYCSRVGIRLAAKEAGLESSLEEEE